MDLIRIKAIIEMVLSKDALSERLMFSLRPTLDATLIALALLGAALLVRWDTAMQSATTYSRETRLKPYDDVLAELEIAVTERNFRITGHNAIGRVIREREGRPFEDYDSYQFCNLAEAKTLLELSPEAVNWMPCSLTVRTEGDRIIVTTALLPTHGRNPALNRFAEKMNQRLREIVDFSVE